MASCGTLTVRVPFSGDAVSVSCEGVSQEVSPGGQATATFGISNGNDQPASVTVEVVVDGQQRATRTVSASPGSNPGLTIAFTAPSSEGEFDVSVNKVGATEAAARSALPGAAAIDRALPRGLNRSTAAVGSAGLGAAVLAALL